MKPNWFVALPVAPGSWLARVGAAPAGVRVFHPDDLHLTIAFLGVVDEVRAHAAFEQARALPLEPTEATLGEVVPLGNPRKPSALSARVVVGEAEIARAMTAVRDAICDAAHAPREQRPALPHLTLARIARSATREQRAEALGWAARLALGEPRVQIAEVALYTWAVERSTRQFRSVASQPLR